MSASRFAPVLLILGLAFGIAGCGKDGPPTAPSPVVPASPSPAPSCASAVSDPPSVPLAISGAEFAISVTAANGCSWTANSISSFIVTTGPTTGTGPGSVRFTVQANSSAPRQGRVQVAGRELAIVQAGTDTAACAFEVTPTERTVAPQGGDLSVTIAVTSGTDCTWTTASQSAFLTITSAASGKGPGTATVAVSANAGSARVGTVTIAGRTVTVLQEGTAPSSCAFSVTPTQSSQPAAGGTIVVTITKTQGSACPWIAQVQSPFLSISGASSGLDNGSVTIAVAPNGGSARGGSVGVAGQTVSITQGAPSLPCVLSILPTQANVLAAGGSTFTIVSKTQGGVCPWTAQSQSPFITITSGSSGVDQGGVSLHIDPNTGGDRQGTVLVAGQTFTVIQAGANSPCAFRVAPADISAGAAMMSSMIYITQISGQNCAWSAQSSAPFVTVDPASGVIPGLGYTNAMVFIGANTGPGRSATVTFGNATLSIAQAGALPSSSAAVLTFDSEPGDDIGQGQSKSFTFTGSQFEVTPNAAAGTLTFNTPLLANPRLQLNLAAPTGQPLAAGYYAISQRFASAGVAGVDFSYNGRGCNMSTGRLLVQEAVYGPGNTVERFHARFEQHCEGFSAALRGTIWIDAQGSITPPTLAPFPAPGAGATFFSYQSEPGDILGGGGSGSFTLASAVFTPTTANSQEVVINIRSQPVGAFNWNLLFSTGSGALPLAGTYDPATDPAALGAARVRVSGPGSCSGSTLAGKFTVIEAVYGPGGTVLRFRATFEVRCGASAAALRGEVWILADPWR